VIEQRLLVLEQPVVTGVERVNVGKRGIGAEQIAQRAPLKPVPMQSPLAARRQQPLRYQHKEHLIETRALTRSGQSLAPERVEFALLPELQADHALGLHHAELAVLFAVLLASGRAQKHPGTRLSAERRRAPEARSSLQRLLRDSSHSRSNKPTGYTARQSKKHGESAKSG